MGKSAIVVVSVVALICDVVGGIGYAVSGAGGQVYTYSATTATFNCMLGAGVLLGFLVWLWAVRDAWLCKAYGWLVAIVLMISFSPIVPLLYGLLGPGRLAIMAEKRLSWLLAVGPQAAGVPGATPATLWTVPMLKQSLNYYAGFDRYQLVESDDTLVRTIHRFNWRVMNNGMVTR